MTLLCYTDTALEWFWWKTSFAAYSISLAKKTCLEKPIPLP